MAGMTGWLFAESPADSTRFAGGVRVFCIGSAVFALAFAALALLAFNASPRESIALGVFLIMAAGNGLSAFGLTTRSRWGVHVGVWWNLIAFSAWFLLIFVVQGFSGQRVSLVLIGAGLVFATLFHMAAVHYLAYGRRPNLRYRERVPDPRYWGAHWVRVPKADAVGHAEGRFGGKLWIVLGLILLSGSLEASGLWLSPGAPQMVGVGFHLLLLGLLILRRELAWPLTFLWAAVSFLRSVGVTGSAEYFEALFWPMILAGPVCAFASIWVMIYFAEGARPNLVYLKRYRRVLDGEVF